MFYRISLHTIALDGNFYVGNSRPDSRFVVNAQFSGAAMGAICRRSNRTDALCIVALLQRFVF